jgi:hypothetical protein
MHLYTESSYHHACISALHAILIRVCLIDGLFGGGPCWQSIFGLRCVDSRMFFDAVIGPPGFDCGSSTSSGSTAAVLIILLTQ